MSRYLEQVRGPGGRAKNCNEWALYEGPHASSSAAMCNGGYYKGDRYKECPSKERCKDETRSKRAARGGGPRLNPSRPFTREIGGTPNLPKFSRLGEQPTSIPQRTDYPLLAPEYGQVMPVPITPPAHYPVPMRTMYATPLPQYGGLTPVFLPTTKKEIVSRLGKNVVQGMLGSAGAHLHSYMMTVDVLG